MAAALPKKTRELHNHLLDSTVWNDFKFRDDDIVIATYAKAGTTWVQQIISQLLFNGEAGLEVAEMSPWVDRRCLSKEGKLAALEAQKNRRFVKTHLPVDALVFSKKAKYVFIGRDGRDVIKSFHNHHLKTIDTWYDLLNEMPGRVGPPMGKPNANFRQYFLDWLGKDGYPWWPFWEYIRSWWEIRELPNVYMIHFQNLKADMPGEIKRLAEFLGIEVDPRNWDDILEHCSFDYMKANGEKIVPGNGLFFADGPKSFINKGTSGGWKDDLNDEDIARYQADAIKELEPECARWLSTGM